MPVSRPIPIRDAYFHGMRKFRTCDPDGHVVWFGQDMPPDNDVSSKE